MGVAQGDQEPVGGAHWENQVTWHKNGTAQVPGKKRWIDHHCSQLLLFSKQTVCAVCVRAVNAFFKFRIFVVFKCLWGYPISGARDAMKMLFHFNAFFLAYRVEPTGYDFHSKYCGKREHRCGDDVVYVKTGTKPFTQNAYFVHFLEGHLSVLGRVSPPFHCISCF